MFKTSRLLDEVLRRSSRWWGHYHLEWRGRVFFYSAPFWHVHLQPYVKYKKRPFLPDIFKHVYPTHPLVMSKIIVIIDFHSWCGTNQNCRTKRRSRLCPCFQGSEDSNLALERHGLSQPVIYDPNSISFDKFQSTETTCWYIATIAKFFCDLNCCWNRSSVWHETYSRSLPAACKYPSWSSDG